MSTLSLIWGFLLILRLQLSSKAKAIKWNILEFCSRNIQIFYYINTDVAVILRPKKIIANKKSRKQQINVYV